MGFESLGVNGQGSGVRGQGSGVRGQGLGSERADKRGLRDLIKEGLAAGAANLVHGSGDIKGFKGQG